MRPLTANTDNRFHPPQRDGHEKTGDIFFQKALRFKFVTKSLRSFVLPNKAKFNPIKFETL
ncbi:MAG TPA: hypothetical protein DCW71_01350 [Alistipes sp.]|nr:hypothetical protein [Alistipes sp.]